MKIHLDFPKVAVLLLALLAFGTMSARLETQNQAADGFSVTDAMVPTRDGVRLNTKIYVPKDQSEPLPIILLRTPYGINGISGRRTE